jgi:hypothetical protein
MATYRDPAISALVASSDALQRLSAEVQEEANLLSRRLADLLRQGDDRRRGCLLTRAFGDRAFVVRGATR